jgi:hypothetical protein
VYGRKLHKYDISHKKDGRLYRCAHFRILIHIRFSIRLPKTSLPCGSKKERALHVSRLLRLLSPSGLRPARSASANHPSRIILEKTIRKREYR